MPTMIRAVALLAVALAFASCGEEGPDVASADQLERARAETRAAVEATEVLEDRLADLEDEIRAAEVADRKSGRELKASIGRLEKALDRLKETSGDSASIAQSAAAEIAAAVRRLTVLEDRFNYHLKRYHGG